MDSIPCRVVELFRPERSTFSPKNVAVPTSYRIPWKSSSGPRSACTMIHTRDVGVGLSVEANIGRKSSSRA